MKTKEILEKYDFHVKKKFGQNFLTDENLLNNIVSNSLIDNETGVIEIGPGLGALTTKLANVSKKVLAYEIDKELIPILDEVLSSYNNITVLNKDILKSNVLEDINKYLKDCKQVYVVANLPYYITTPILLYLLETCSVIKKYVVMMQMEVADRICGNPKTKDYNSLTIAIRYRANAKKLIKVPASSFIPRPNVDSCVISLESYEEKKYFPNNETFFFDCVRSSFAQRRKTLINNLITRYNRERYLFEECFKEINIPLMARSEELSIDDFIKLSNALIPYLEEKEQLDVYNESREKTGEFILRGEKLKEGHYFLVVVGILKKDDKYLIQRRSFKKLCWPGKWALTCGAVSKGESSLTGIKREIEEELGVKFKDNEYVLRNKTMDKNIHAIVDVYEINVDKEINFKPNEEVIEYKWVTYEEMLSIYEQGDFVEKDFMHLHKNFSTR